MKTAKHKVASPAKGTDKALRLAQAERFCTAPGNFRALNVSKGPRKNHTTFSACLLRLPGKDWDK
jgi:hypothetical protein